MPLQVCHDDGTPDYTFIPCRSRIKQLLLDAQAHSIRALRALKTRDAGLLQDKLSEAQESLREADAILSFGALLDGVLDANGDVIAEDQNA